MLAQLTSQSMHRHLLAPNSWCFVVNHVKHLVYRHKTHARATLQPSRAAASRQALGGLPALTAGAACLACLSVATEQPAACYSSLISHSFGKFLDAPRQLTIQTTIWGSILGASRVKWPSVVSTKQA